MVYENDEPSEVGTLVYVEDLSQNGSYWNGSFIGKGNGGFLLSDEDVLRLSRRTYLVFTSISSRRATDAFDYLQETEMAVRYFNTTSAARTDIDRNSAMNTFSRTDYWALVHSAKYTWRSNKQLDIKWLAKSST